jgi:hypothetical protein
MDPNVVIQIFSLAVLAVYLVWSLAEINRLKQDMKDFGDRVVERLTDPKTIEAEMERTATLTEVRDANRTTLPREDAGPPAVLYRPLLRGQKPGSWRPRSATVFQKIERGEDWTKPSEVD